MTVGDAELAIAAADAGARVARERFGGQLTRTDKSPTDFATDADVDAEKAILAVIRSARPDDALVGEETGEHVSAHTRRTWLVDPLCGTLNYAATTGLVAVNVALQADDVTAAASADPFAGEVFWTHGRAAHVRRAGADQVLTPSARSRLVDVNLDPPFPNGDSFRTVQLLADPDFERLFRPRVVSTSLALAWVAAGRRAAYVTDGQPQGSVHFASGIALCQAAGCVVTDLRGQPLTTTPAGLVAAADQETHATLLSIIGHFFGDRRTLVISGD